MDGGGDASAAAAARTALSRHEHNLLESHVCEFVAIVNTDGEDGQRRHSQSRDELSAREVPADDAPEPNHAVVFSLGLHTKHYVPNADTISECFANVHNKPAEVACGVLLDTVNGYDWVRAGVNSKNLKGKAGKLVGEDAQIAINRIASGVQAFQENLRLPRDLRGETADEFVRLHMLVPQTSKNKTKDVDCLAQQLVCQHREAFVDDIQKTAKKNGTTATEACALLKMSLNEGKTFRQFAESANAMVGESFIAHRDMMDPSSMLGNFHVEAMGNPRSKFFGSFKDRPSLLYSLDLNEDDKCFVEKMRALALEIYNDCDQYLMQNSGDDGAQELFTFPMIESVYPLCANFGSLSLPSQFVGSLKTPKNMKETAPTCVMLNKCFLNMHNSNFNKAHFEALRKKLKLAPGKMQTHDMFTFEGSRTLWLPSSIDKKDICKTTPATITEKSNLFDFFVNGAPIDQDIVLDRCDEGSMDYEAKWELFREKVYEFACGVFDDSCGLLEVPVFLAELDSNGDEQCMVDYSESDPATSTGRRVIVYAPAYPLWRRAAKKRFDDVTLATKAIYKFAQLCRNTGFMPDGQMFWDEVTCNNASHQAVDDNEEDSDVDIELSDDSDGDELGEDQDDAIMNDDEDASSSRSRKPILLQRHYAIPKDDDIEFRKSKKKVKVYCKKTNARKKKKIPIMQIKMRHWRKPTFYPEAQSCHARMFCRKQNYHLSDDAKMLYIDLALEDDVPDISVGPDFSRSRKSMLMVQFKRTTVEYRSGVVSVNALERYGVEFVDRVIYNGRAEYRVANCLRPSFERLFERTSNNLWRLKQGRNFCLLRLHDPDDRLADCIQRMHHMMMRTSGFIFSGYKNGNLIFYTWQTAFVVLESNELKRRKAQTVCVIFYGKAASGKSTLCQSVLSWFANHHVISTEGNSANNGLGTYGCMEENRISYADEMNLTLDKEALRIDKERKSANYTQKTRLAASLSESGQTVYKSQQLCNRRSVAEVGNLNEIKQGGEDFQANLDRALVVRSEAKKLAHADTQSLFQVPLRTLTISMEEQNAETGRASKKRTKMLDRMVNNTERCAILHAFYATLPKDCGAKMHNDLARSMWQVISDYLSKHGCVVDQRPRLRDSMVKIEQASIFYHAVAACFDAAQKDGENIEFKPENFWRILPYLHSTQRTACNTYLYCSAEILRVNHNFVYMDAFFSALYMNTHRKGSSTEAYEARKEFMEDPTRYDSDYLVSVFLVRSNVDEEKLKKNTCAINLRREWMSKLSDKHQIDADDNQINMLWKDLVQVNVCMANWKVRPRTEAEMNANDGMGMKLSEIADAEYKMVSASTEMDREPNCMHNILPIIQELDDNETDQCVKPMIKVEVATRIENGKEKKFAIMQVHVAGLRNVIMQRQRSNNSTVDKTAAIPPEQVAKEFEKSEKSMMKCAIQYAMSYKNCTRNPIRQAKIDEMYSDTSATAGTGRYLFRQKRPGMRHCVCRDDDRVYNSKYVTTTVAEPPAYHSGEVLDQSICDTVVSTESDRKFNLKNKNIFKDVREFEFDEEDDEYEPPVNSNIEQFLSQDVPYDADLWQNFIVYLTLCKPGNILCNESYAYSAGDTFQTKFDKYMNEYCKEFEPSFSAVLNLKVSSTCGHSPQNIIADIVANHREARGIVVGNAQYPDDAPQPLLNPQDDNLEDLMDDNLDNESEMELEQEDLQNNNESSSSSSSNSPRKRRSPDHQSQRKKKRRKKSKKKRTGVHRFFDSGAEHSSDSESEHEDSANDSDRNFICDDDDVEYESGFANPDSVDVMAQHAALDNSFGLQDVRIGEDEDEQMMD